MSYFPGSPSATSFQRRFLNFHNTIKLDHFDENRTLREKRDAVLERLVARGPRFDRFNQGSYAMGTGCVPVDGDFDIDVGIVFSGPASTRPDPLDLKRRVRDAVNGHTTTPAGWMRHCVRVQYTRQGSELYHVDLAVYWQNVETSWDGQPRKGDMYLAVGKEGSVPPHKAWLESEPLRLRDMIADYQSGEARSQFKRVIRYLKRWRQEHFPSTGNASPVGIGISVAALQWFYSNAGYGSTEATVDDLDATLQLVNRMRGAFALTVHDGGYAERLVVKLPVKPGLDVFRKMTNQQMREFRQRLDHLAVWLESARSTGKVSYLRQAFGSDFPE